MQHIRRFAKARKPKPPGQLNKTEEAYEAHLAERKMLGMIRDYGVQRCTLKLGPDCRYTPDFDVLELDDTITFHEVKGGKRVKRKDGSTDVKPFAMDDALVKVRTATTVFPQFRFCVAYRLGKEPWRVEEVG